MATNEPLSNATDEVAAAEAELRAAQERLAAAKARMAEESGESASGGGSDDVAAEERLDDERADDKSVKDAVIAEDAEAAEAVEVVEVVEMNGASAASSNADEESNAYGAQASDASVAGGVVDAVGTSDAVGAPTAVGFDEASNAAAPQPPVAASSSEYAPPPSGAPVSSVAPGQQAGSQTGEPDWVPYSTSQIPTPPSYGSPVRNPADASFYQPPAPVGYGHGYAAPQPQYRVQPQPQSPTPQPPHAGPGAVPPQQPYYGYVQQPYYQQPYTQPMVNVKDHVAAGLLAIFLGPLGVHKFYLGYNTAGFIMLAVSILGGIFTLSLATWVIWIIAIIEGILYFMKPQAEFEQMYVLNKREWF